MDEKMEGFFKPLKPGELQEDAPSAPTVPMPPAKQCQVVVTYAPSRPDLPAIAPGSGDCAASAEVALAVALAAMLKSGLLPLVPR